MYRTPWLLFFLATAFATNVTATSAPTNGTATSACDPDSTIFALCDGWSIAAIVMFGILALLIVVRIITSYVQCDCAGKDEDKEEPPAPPPPVLVAANMPRSRKDLRV